MKKRDERWTEHDVKLVEARRQLRQAVKTPPLEATTARTYSFTVPGLAQPGGSKTAFALYDKKKVCRCGPVPGFVPLRRQNGSIIINVTADNDKRVTRWRKHIARVAREEYAGPLFDGFLRVTFIFYQPRPQDHYTSTGKLSKHGIETPWPNVKPDVTKLVRAIEDELREICYTDDAIIVKQRAEKEYGTPARVEITIEELVLPAQQDQADLFGALEPPAPWETEASAGARQKASEDRPGLVSAVTDPKDTCDGGTSHSDQSGETVEPAPWDAQDPARSEKKNGKNSRGKVIA